MIPAPRHGTASISRRPAAVAALLFACAAGCLAPGEPTLARLARDRRDGQVFAEREQRLRQLRLAEQETRDMLAAIAAAKARTVELAATLRAVRAQLAIDLDRLQTAERDLDAARARLDAIEAGEPAPDAAAAASDGGDADEPPLPPR